MRDLELLDRNGVVPDELTLPAIRHRAFAELDRAEGYPSWPVPSGEPSPPVGARGVPEVGVGDLTGEAVRSAINEHGCLLVRDVADAHEVATLTDGIDRAFAGVTRRQRSASGRVEPSPWYAPLKVPANPTWVAGRIWVEQGGGVLTADSPRVLRELLDLFERRGMRRAVADYLGERPILSATKCTMRRVEPDSDSHWHQDGSFLGDGLRVLNVWLSLSRCGRDAPGLDLVPRRLDHVVATGTGDARFGNMVGDDEIAHASEGAGVIRPEFQPGEALLFDELLLHSTAADPSMPCARYAVESWFFAPSAYPDPDDQVPLVW